DLKLRGVGVQSLFGVRRLRREIDRTLELAPDYPDALVGKGELLCELPRLLGGDAAEGERLLRAALRVDPEFVEAHLGLARALAAHRRGFVRTHTPPWHMSVRVRVLPSSQEAPSCLAGLEHWPVAGLQLPAL